MLQRQLLLVVILIIGNVSFGLTQSLGDFARAERARRKGFAGNRPADTSAKSPTRDALIKEAVRVSGAKRQLEQAVETFRPSLGDERAAEGFSPQEYQQAINEVFKLDRLIRGVEQSVPESVQDSTLAEVVRFYGSPLGRKIAATEADANVAGATARFQYYASTTAEKSVSVNRQELVEAISAAGLGIPRPPREAGKTVEARGTGIWFQFIYESLTDVELSSYLTFLKSPAATEFNNAMWSGMDATLGDAAQRLAQRLSEKKR